jgi:hypothetical protein
MTEELKAKPKTPSQAQLEGWLAYWQASLGLMDWMVGVKLVRAMEGNIVGQCRHSQVHQQADIELLDPYCYGPRENDIEVTLVHELLHIHFAPFEYEKADSPEGIAQERAIIRISRALVHERREGKR